MVPLDLSLSVAMTPKRVIGMNNALPWELPSDLAQFKKITMEARVVVMGRNTCQSILERNKKPLVGRHSIVLTSDYQSFKESDSLECVASLQEALDAIMKQGGHACIIGGERVYRLFLPLIRTAYVTMVHAEIEGDAHFPEDFADTDWRHKNVSGPMTWHPGDQYATSYFVFHRING